MRALTVAVLIVVLSVVTARRHRNQRREKLRCEYDAGSWGDCDSETNLVTRVLTLRDGAEECLDTQDQTISCEKFQKIQEWKAKKMERNNGEDEWKTERKNQRHEWKGRNMERKNRRHWNGRKHHGQESQNCKYDKGDWSECDSTTNTVTRILTLRDTEEDCEPTMEVSISCEKYERIQAWKANKMENNEESETRNMLRENWKLIKEQEKLGCNFDVSFSECDESTKLITKTYTPEVENESCQTSTISYSCQLHDRMMERKMKRQEWKNDRKRGRFQYKRHRKHHRKSGRF